MGNGTQSIPGQCIYIEKAGDGKANDCLDRSDEDPFQEEKEAILDLAKLQHCTEYGSPGLECGRGCIRMIEWCNFKSNQECPVLGAGIHTNNPILCANNTFWRKQIPEGTQRWCQAGYSGQSVSIYFSGLSEDVQVGGQVSGCRDGSDLYRLIKQPTEVKESDHQASQLDYNYKEHGSDDEQSGDEEYVEEYVEEYIENHHQPLEEDFDEHGSDREQSISDKTYSAEAHGDQHPQQVWKIYPIGEARHSYFKEEKKGENYRQDSSTGLWMIPVSDPFKVPSIAEEDMKIGPKVLDASPQRMEEWADFYSSDDYIKDEATNRMVAAPTEDTCRANDGFVCKVRQQTKIKFNYNLDN